MGRFRGRPRHGSSRKESHTVSLDPALVRRLERLGTDSAGKVNLSAGIAIVDHATRGMDLSRYRARQIAQTRVDERRSWIVYELVDGPADPPPAEGVQVDAWREA